MTARRRGKDLMRSGRLVSSVIVAALLVSLSQAAPVAAVQQCLIISGGCTPCGNATSLSNPGAILAECLWQIEVLQRGVAEYGGSLAVAVLQSIESKDLGPILAFMRERVSCGAQGLVGAYDAVLQANGTAVVDSAVSTAQGAQACVVVLVDQLLKPAM